MVPVSATHFLVAPLFWALHPLHRVSVGICSPVCEISAMVHAMKLIAGILQTPVATTRVEDDGGVGVYPPLNNRQKSFSHSFEEQHVSFTSLQIPRNSTNLGLFDWSDSYTS
jgi:hypothetical protein